MSNIELNENVQDVPDFDPACCGTPADWRNIRYWGKGTRHLLKVVPDAQPDINKIWRFLEKRLGPDGNPITSTLEAAVDKGDGWYRMRYLLHRNIWMPRVSLAESGGAAEWTRAWHGCPFEAVYSILFNGILIESSDDSLGHRFFDTAPGVYCHKETLAQKAENYTMFCPLFGDGTLWACKFEVHVDRTDKVKPRQKTKQWVQRSRSVRIVALWVCGKTIQQLTHGTAFTSTWNPLLESNPVKMVKDPQKQCSIERIDYFRTFSISNSRSNRILKEF